MKRRARARRLDLLDTLPPLSDEAAVALTSFLAELACQLEGRLLGQILRHRDQQREDRSQHRSTMPTEPSDPPF